MKPCLLKLDSAAKQQDLKAQHMVDRKMEEFGLSSELTRVPEHLDGIDGSIDELTELTACKHAELERRLQSEKLRVAGLIQDIKMKVSKVNAPVSSLDCQMQLHFIQRSEVNELILGTLQAALLPLANVVTEKLDDFDRRLRFADAVSLGGAG